MKQRFVLLLDSTLVWEPGQERTVRHASVGTGEDCSSPGKQRTSGATGGGYSRWERPAGMQGIGEPMGCQL